jgi:hypothetical protein
LQVDFGDGRVLVVHGGVVVDAIAPEALLDLFVDGQPHVALNLKLRGVCGLAGAGQAAHEHNAGQRRALGWPATHARHARIGGGRAT